MEISMLRFARICRPICASKHSMAAYIQIFRSLPCRLLQILCDRTESSCSEMNSRMCASAKAGRLQSWMGSTATFESGKESNSEEESYEETRFVDRFCSTGTGRRGVPTSTN